MAGRGGTLVGSMGRKRKEPDQSTYSGRICARVCSLRIGSGKTARAMAKALGVPYSTYATYENGSAAWPDDLTPRFAKVLGINPRTVYPTE